MGSSGASPGTTAFTMHPDSALHDTGWGHPEHQGRLRALARAVDRDMAALRGHVVPLEADAASPEDAMLVHSEAHLSTVREAVERAARTGAVRSLDADTRVSAASWDAALGALGATLGAVGEVARGAHRNAFVATRPPGHHATPERAMGFCLINHVACAARWLQDRGLAERVLIIDWDVHHGNGTQDVFWTDPTVFYLSLHQYPHYPGTGRQSEQGDGPGRGFTKNVELSAGTSPERYLAEFRAALEEVRRRFMPDFILISAGFDCLAGDPLGDLQLEPFHLHGMTRMVTEYARRAPRGTGNRGSSAEEPRAGKRIAADAVPQVWSAVSGEAEDSHEVGVVACLEGGYDPDRTARGVLAVLRALAGLPAP